MNMHKNARLTPRSRVRSARPANMRFTICIPLMMQETGLFIHANSLQAQRGGAHRTTDNVAGRHRCVAAGRQQRQPGQLEAVPARL